MGIVVVAFIRDDVKEQLPPECPIVSATHESLPDVLRDLIKDPARRHQIGVASRQFVEIYHDTSAVIEKLCTIYTDTV